jgi:hypothetical protein
MLGNLRARKHSKGGGSSPSHKASSKNTVMEGAASEIDANGAPTTLRALSCYCVVRDGKSGKEVRGDDRGRVHQLWWCSVVAGHECPSGGSVFGIGRG